MRQTEGSMLVTSGLVIFDPPWVNMLLRALLDRRLSDPDNTTWWMDELERFCDGGLIRCDQLIEAHQKFIRSGRLTKIYL